MILKDNILIFIGTRASNPCPLVLCRRGRQRIRKVLVKLLQTLVGVGDAHKYNYNSFDIFVFFFIQISQSGDKLQLLEDISKERTVNFL